jgi:CDP-diacylglycerol--serine O-phosphatidyltransferase
MNQSGFIKNIPNGLTSLNLISGCIAIALAFHGMLSYAGYFILAAAVFDFFDGMVARSLKVHSPIGKELDSLADVVSFGVAPSIILLQLMAKSLMPQQDVFIGFFESFSSSEMDPLTKIFMYRNVVEFGFWTYFFLATPLLIAVFSAVRLAKFNIDTRQTTSFIGLPTPANAIFILSLGFISETVKNPTVQGIIIHPMTLFFVSAIFSYLLVCEMPMFAIKFKNFGIKDNALKYGFIVVSLILLAIFKLYALPIVILLYILVSFVVWVASQLKANNDLKY